MAMSGAAGGTAVPPFAWAEPAGVPAALGALDIRVRRPVLVLIGGADGMTPDHMTAMAQVMARIIPALDGWGAAVVDGGTDSGVMRVAGQAHDAAGVRFPLVGVAAEGTVILPGRPAPADAVALEPHHTHVILVPGNAWGDESPWLDRVATAIADGQPSLTLVINGGDITYDDIEHSLQSDRPVIILAGTGSAADTIAGAAHGAATDPRAARVAAAPRAQVISLTDPQALYHAMKSILAPAR